ncbi:glycosyltransferase [Arthrobacter sp. zg-Y1219]|uniref:glycosyltransferase n=1 Tax=Arthrobacter sp. zg-Y1219 TaxID=3049067 RepID=UPI0024C3DEE1|nr:glycosyltransferase [Arthrobacter sp. zg-Y1219]MDK1360185.1 glycosyltransferase [Arthrobacter sp. zg-Y1219]
MQRMTTLSVDNPHLDLGTENKYLFVASTGGHLAQLKRMSTAMLASPDSLWVTFDSEQSRSLLAEERVHHVPYIASRDFRGVITASKEINMLMRHEKFDAVVSTGAALALAAMPVARGRRVPTRYIESVSRVDGPSLTGKIIAALRLAELRTQHESWANGRWKKHPSVLTQFQSATKIAPSATAEELKIFVTLGTIKPYEFDAMIDSLLRTGLCNENTTWQLGSTQRENLPGRVLTQTSASEFEHLCATSDVVVTHSGVGTILNLLESGIHPVVVPRRKQRNEHVDDHQLQIAKLVAGLGVATVCEAPDLEAEHIIRAASLCTVPAVHGAPE